MEPPVKNDARALAWLGLWLGLIAALLAVVLHTFRLSADLRLFLPQPATTEQELVLEGIGEGPAARLLILALDGGEPLELARISHALSDRLRKAPEFRFVINGSAEIPRWLVDNRYLLTASFDRQALDAPQLRMALEERLQDLASPAAPILESLVPVDPTLEIAAVAARWAPRKPPRTIDGAWFDAEGRRALLLVQTQAAAFDPDGQQQALTALYSGFRFAKAGRPNVRMIVSGPGRFAALMKERTQRETAWLGTAATAGLVVLLILAYRRWRVPILAPLPLATAALAGLATVGTVYGDVHGITLAFGFTLIGVAQDYPIHFFSHQRGGLAPLSNARGLWPTLATGVAATCVAYVAFLASGVTGLAQLGLFSITGLVVAGLTTRYLLPRIIGEEFRDQALSPTIARLERFLSLLRISPPACFAILGTCFAIILFARGAPWQDDLGALTPVPPELLAQDSKLRSEVGAPDPRFIGVVLADDAEGALQELERLEPGLDALVEAGAIAGFDHAAKYLPSERRQRMRQARLPAPAELTAALEAATEAMPFRAGVFAPFLADVERARTQPPLALAALRDSGQAALVEGLLHARGSGTEAIIAFSGVSDAGRLAQWAAGAGPEIILIDLKEEASALAVAQRERILSCLAVAAVLLLLVLCIALRDWRRVARVVAPMALTTAAIVAVLRAFGTPLDLFHLMSLVLAAGLGVDYALFFERSEGDRDERLRTLHGVLVCSVSTLMVFALLSLSSIPVLRSIGVTVTLGVVMNFVLALALPRGRARPA
jgi:predicted exporter